MYKIYADGSLLHDSRLIKEGYGVIKPKLTTEIGKAGSLEYTMPPSHVLYGKTQKLKTIIKVYDDDERLFRGRILHDESDFYKRKKTYCEGDINFLLDTQQRPYAFKGDLPEFFRKIIENHNKKVGEDKRFAIGKVTVSDANNYINRENQNYSTTLSEIKEKIIETHGGYLGTREEDGKEYIDLLESYENISDQMIEFGKNLIDISEYISAEDVFTILIPVGASQKDADGNDVGKLTITNINSGRDYIKDEEAVKIFGVIEKTVEWNDVTIAENLLKKAKEYLQNGIEMAVKLTVKAVDLSLMGVNTKKIKAGDWVRVVSIPHGIDKLFLCRKIVYDLEDPSKSEYTFGIDFGSLTERQIKGVKGAQATATAAKMIVENIGNDVDKAKQNVIEMQESIIKIPDAYVKKEDFEELVKRVEALENGGTENE